MKNFVFINKRTEHYISAVARIGENDDRMDKYMGWENHMGERREGDKGIWGSFNIKEGGKGVGK
jgi:hypothetical protein